MRFLVTWWYWDGPKVITKEFADCSDKFNDFISELFNDDKVSGFGIKKIKEAIE